MADLVDSNVNWDLTLVHEYVPSDVRMKIEAIMPPRIDGKEDTIQWDSINGKFSISSVYEFLFKR